MGLGYNCLYPRLFIQRQRLSEILGSGSHSESTLLSFISVLHFRESLGLRGEDHIYLMKEHFYQALNETEHLEEMEKRGGDEHWIDRFFAKHLVLLYYWIMVAYYLIDPIDAYDINMKIEKHAFETYVKYGAYHPEDTKIQEIAQDEYEHSKELQQAMLMIA